MLAGLFAVVVLLTIPEPTIGNLSSQEPLIQAHLDAWYGGDFEAAMSLRAAERLRTGPPEDRVRGGLNYQAMLGAWAEVVGCEPLPPETVRCDVAYSNALIEAVGQAPIVLSQQFGIRDGLLVFVAGPYLEDVEVTASFREFALETFPAEYEDACVTEPNHQPPECAALKLLHMDDWVVWHQSRY